MSIDFGVFIPQGWRMDLTRIADPVEQYEAMTNAGKKAGELGFDSVWVYDHFHTVPEPTKNTVFECWTITAGLVRDLKNIKVGQMVSCNGYRNPALLAKMASTVDAMSAGRLLFGLGAGWYEHEWLAYGYGFPEVPERMRAFKESCEIIHRMWTEDDVTFDGEFYSVDRPINEPKHAMIAGRAHPPFWIGGGGEKVTLKLVAKFGDACNVGGDVQTIKHKFDVLKRHCDDAGRDYDEITRSSSCDFHIISPGEDREAAIEAFRGDLTREQYTDRFNICTPEEAVEEIQAKVDAGVNYVLVYLPGLAYDHEQMERLATEVIPHISN